MNKYNHWIAKLFGKLNGSTRFAVTFGQTAYFSVDEATVPNYWHVHEDTHKLQYKRDGWIKFLTRYIFQLITKGYRNIDYEIEARQEAFKVGGPAV